MSTVFSGRVHAATGEVRVWADGRELGRAPLLQMGFEVCVDGPPRRVSIEHIVDGTVRRGRVVEVSGERVEVGELTRGSTLRAEAWRQAWERGLGGRYPLLEALLPDEVGDALGAMPRALRGQARDLLLRTLRVALHAQQFPWSWESLDPQLQEHLSAPMRTLLLVGVWRSALRVSNVDRPLVDLCEPAAAALELRACRLAARVLGQALEPVGVKLPDPGSRPVSSWSVAVLFSLRAVTDADVLTPAAVCSEVSIAIDRALDGIVAKALDRDDPQVLENTLAQQVAYLESSLQRDLADTVGELPGGWTAVAALWVSTLAGLGFNADIDRSTESYTIPST